MQKCKELSRLKKVTGPFSSVLFRGQTPGSSNGAHINLPRTVLDPSHPATRLNRNFLPNARTNALGLTAVPFSLLEERDIPRQPPFNYELETWKERMERTLRNPDFDTQKIALAPVNLPKFQRPGRLPMSLVTVVAKKKTSKRRFVRLRIINKLKTSLYLVLIRGAEANEGRIVMDERTVDPGLVLRGWTYIFFPNIDMYLMPFPDIVKDLRKLLNIIRQKATNLEMQWAQESLGTMVKRPAEKRDSKNSFKLNAAPLPSDTNTSRPSSPPALEANIEADRLWQKLANPVEEPDTFSDAELNAPENSSIEDSSWISDEFEMSESAFDLDPSSSAQALDLEHGTKNTATSLGTYKPIINLVPPSPSPPPTTSSSQTSSASRAKPTRKWNYNATQDAPPAAPGTAAAVEDEWAKAYSSPLEMAKRKIFHSQPIFGKIPAVKGNVKARSARVGDVEARRNKRPVDANSRKKGKELKNKMFKLYDEKAPIDETGTGFGIKKEGKTSSGNGEAILRRSAGGSSGDGY